MTLDPSPHTQDLYTSSGYLENNPDYHQGNSPWKARHVLRMIERNKLAPRTICDIGCGAGRVLQVMQGALPPDTELEGYDISPDAIAIAAQHQNAHLRYAVGDALATGKHWDLILLLDVLEHLEDYYAFLRAARPKSTFKLIHVPVDLTALTALRPRLVLNPRRNAGHLHFFTRELIVAVLRDCGYEVLDTAYTAPALDLPQKAMGGKVARWPRKLLYAMAPDLTVRMLGGFSVMVLAK